MPATLAPLPLAAVGEPLFGSQWLALLAVIGVIAILLALVALAGRWLAATHPVAPSTPTAPDAAPAAAPSAPVPAAATAAPTETLVVIASAVATLLGSRARIASVRLATPPPSVEALMLQWSLEGRRQIYSSHKVR